MANRNNFGSALAWLAGASFGILAYGALFESKRLVLERRRIRLPRWPKSLNGLKAAVLADLHLRDRYSLELAQRAVAMAIAEEPDIFLIPGDIVGYWKEESSQLLMAALEPLGAVDVPVIAVPGNHEYWSGTPELLLPVFDALGIELLRNSARSHLGVQWVGIDSANEGRARPEYALSQAGGGGDPIVVIWHEPDVVEELPPGAALMISGHSHGGQFRLPNGWAPMYTLNGRKYPEGFYPDAPTPLYVSRGVGTTGPPSRLFCPPEVSLLELWASGPA